jgi:hypothetical protein
MDIHTTELNIVDTCVPDHRLAFSPTPRPPPATRYRHLCHTIPSPQERERERQTDRQRNKRREEKREKVT